MRTNPKCYGCYWFKQCDEMLETKCEDMNYALYTTKEDAELCSLLCGEVEEDED